MKNKFNKKVDKVLDLISFIPRITKRYFKIHQEIEVLEDYEQEIRGFDYCASILYDWLAQFEFLIYLYCSFSSKNQEKFI